VPASIPAGTKLYVYRASQVPDETGTPQPTWLETEIVVVGADGFARTASPPYPGGGQSGAYVINELVGIGQGAFHVAASIGLPDPETIFAAVTTGLGAAVGALFSLGASFVFDLPFGTAGVNLVEIPRVGLPRVNHVEVSVNPGTANHFETSIAI